MPGYVDRAANLTAAISITKDSANTSNATGTAVDTEGHDSVTALIDTGTITDGTHTFKLEESDDNSTWNDVATADRDVYGDAGLAIGSTDDDEMVYVNYKGQKRYVRVTVTVSGSPGTGGIYRAYILLQDAHEQPVN